MPDENKKAKQAVADEIKKSKLHVRHAGMPALDEIKKAQLYVRHAGMPASDENKKAKLHVRHAGAGQDSYDMTDEIQRA